MGRLTSLRRLSLVRSSFALTFVGSLGALAGLSSLEYFALVDKRNRGAPDLGVSALPVDAWPCLSRLSLRRYWASNRQAGEVVDRLANGPAADCLVALSLLHPNGRPALATDCNARDTASLSRFTSLTRLACDLANPAAFWPLLDSLTRLETGRQWCAGLAACDGLDPLLNLRSLVVSAPEASLRSTLAIAPNLREVDVTLSALGMEGEVEEACRELLPSLRLLRLKSSGVPSNFFNRRGGRDRSPPRFYVQRY